jgi:hypothetical protein
VQVSNVSSRFEMEASGFDFFFSFLSFALQFKRAAGFNVGGFLLLYYCQLN